jgi:hypothetical protein
MSNLPESTSYDAGIYQIELDDAVIGGVNGISNLQAKGLANRTNWLKSQVDALNLLKGTGIPAFSTGNSYTGGQQVIYQLNIWQANTAISPGAFNPANWTVQLGTAAAGAISTATPLMNGTAAAGSATALSREDHVHPIDTSRAPLASPGLTGTPTAPTAAAGTKTTQVASTAFVADAVVNNTAAVDTGTANTYVCAFTPAITARSEQQPLRFKVKTSNTGASTFNDGLGVVALVGGAHSALQGGELVANGDAWVQWNTSVGGGSYILLFCTGSAEQVAAATKSNHAMQLGQATGRFLKITVFTSSGSFTPLASTNTVRVRVIGGSGASGGTPATSSTQNSVAGGGGGGGYSEGTMTVAAIGTLPATVTVGAGGTGVSAGNGGTGGNSSFIGMTANGGVGGLAGVASAAAYILQPSVGGDSSGGSTINIKGAPSTPAIFITTGAGVSGTGGGSPITGTGGGAGGSVSGGGYLTGTGPGAGPGGVAVGSSVAAQVGVTGNAGAVIIEEYA